MFENMNDITIQMATISDFDGICHLAEQVDQLHVDLLPEVFQSFEGSARTPDRIAHFVEREDADIIIASLGDYVIGCIYIEKASYPGYPMFRSHEYAQIDEMIVDLDHRQKGIGGLLLDSAKQWARDHGLTFMQVNVWSKNQLAKTFYAKKGFKPITEKFEINLDETQT
jgi:GNAT superfamily N-acetyltransferase